MPSALGDEDRRDGDGWWEMGMGGRGWGWVVGDGDGW